MKTLQWLAAALPFVLCMFLTAPAARADPGQTPNLTVAGTIGSINVDLNGNITDFIVDDGSENGVLIHIDNPNPQLSNQIRTAKTNNEGVVVTYTVNGSTKTFVSMVVT